MRTRLQDVARQVGVSVTTVSRVVNGKPGVSDHTRRRVLAELEVLGYDQPRGRRTRSGLVGLIVPELDNPVFPAFVQAIERSLAGHGYLPLLCTASPVTEENEYIDVLTEREVAGIIVVSGRNANADVDHRRYHELRAQGVALVLVGGPVDGLDVPVVSADDAAAAGTAVAHLASLGHVDIGCAMGPVRYTVSRRRVQGFRQAVAARGAHTRASARPDAPPVVHSVFSVQGGLAAATTLLDGGVTALVCGNDLMALGAVRAAHARGLRVPDDVSVIGADDSPLMSFTDPPLTTLRMDVEAMSRHAVATLVDEIVGIPLPRSELLFPPELIVRGSTAPARRRSRP